MKTKEDFAVMHRRILLNFRSDICRSALKNLDSCSMIDFQPENKLAPEKGRLLISEPFLTDPYFKRTVVLLCEHNDQGSFGFVLNRYIDIGIDQIMSDFPSMETRISVGGPVQNSNLFFMHTLGDQIEGSSEIVKGIYLGGHFDLLRDKIESKLIGSAQVRFFIGYSGWSENQLDEELKEKSWLVAPTTDIDLMDTDEDRLWAATIRSLGKDYAYLANFPEDPSLN